MNLADTEALELGTGEVLERTRLRVAELEKERDEVHQYWQIAEGRCDALMKQRDELLAAAEAIEIDAEECLDFDECTAMLVPLDSYHKLIEAIANVKEKPNVQD